MDTTIICKHFTPNSSRVGAESSNDWPYADRAGFDACAKLSTKSELQACGFELGTQNMCNIFQADKTPIAESDTERLVLIRDTTLKFSYVVEDSNGIVVRSILADNEDDAVTSFEATTRGDISRADSLAPKKESYILNVVGV